MVTLNASAGSDAKKREAERRPTKPALATNSPKESSFTLTWVFFNSCKKKKDRNISTRYIKMSVKYVCIYRSG